MLNAGEFAEVNARIVYWGVEGCGKTTNLNAVYAKLRPDHRGELRRVPTRLDPSISYEILPIELGDVAGVRTQIQIIAPPGTPEQAPTRKQLLDRVDGVVVVIDSQRERIDENIASFDELQRSLSAYGRSLEDLPLVVQYNKRDLADPYALEELHRKLQLSGVSVFEAVATEGTGVLQTLSTISKKVIRSLRDPSRKAPAFSQPVNEPESAPRIAHRAVFEPPAPAREARFEPMSPPPTTERTSRDIAEPDLESMDALEVGTLEEGYGRDDEDIEATLEQAQALLDIPWDSVSGEIIGPYATSSTLDLSIVSVGDATRAGDRAVRIPLVLGDSEGQTTSVVLTIQIDPLIGDSLD